MTNNKTSISKKLLKCNLLTRRAAVDSLLSRQERSKEALPAAIKAFGLLLLPGDTSPPDPLAIIIGGILPPNPLFIGEDPKPLHVLVVTGAEGLLLSLREAFIVADHAHMGLVLSLREANSS